MKDYELLERQAELMRMCNGTGLDWRRAGIQHKNSLGWCPRYEDRYYPQVEYRFAVAIVEDKFVFVGDELYAGNGQKFTVGDDYKMILKSDWAKCTWSPPKPKTVMVEMLFDDVQYWCAFSKEELEGYFKASNDPYAKRSMRFYEACDTALSCISLGETK